MMHIEISKELLIAIGLMILGTILWPLIQFLVLPLRRIRRSVKKIEDEKEHLVEKINHHSQEVNALAIQLTESMNNIESIEKRIAVVSDKIGLKGDLLAWGRLMFLEGNFDEAIASLSGMIDSDSSEHSSFYYRGLCYLRKGKRYSKLAWEDLKTAVELSKHNPEYHLALASAYYQDGLLNKAEQEAIEALNLGVTNPLEAKIILGRSRLTAGDCDGATEIFKECPVSHSPAMIGWGEALLEKARRAPPEQKIAMYTAVIDHFTDAIEVNARVADYFNFRAVAYAEMNKHEDWDRALRDWEKANILSPRSTTPWILRGDALYQRAIDLPNHQRDSYLREVIMNYGNALKYAAEAFRPVIRNKRSFVYQQLGEFNRALVEAKAGAKENPRYVVNFMAWATAAISAFVWKEVIEAATSGLEAADKSRNRGGIIWCLLFRIIGRCGDQQRIENNFNDCEQLVDGLEDFRDFDSAKWDWSVANSRIIMVMRDWPSDISSLVQDSILLIEKGVLISHYRTKYLA